MLEASEVLFARQSDHVVVPGIRKSMVLAIISSISRWRVFIEIVLSWIKVIIVIVLLAQLQWDVVLRLQGIDIRILGKVMLWEAMMSLPWMDVSLSL